MSADYEGSVGLGQKSSHMILTWTVTPGIDVDNEYDEDDADDKFS